jgi:hypothetical protein
VRITIPSTLDAATRSLEGLGQLLTTKEWERAANTWAWTRDGRARPTDSESGICTVTH